MDIFKDLKVGINWQVLGESPFSQDCINLVEKAEIVPSDYGQSVCFFMHSGDKKYIPVLSANYPGGGFYPIGTQVNMNTSTVVTVQSSVDHSKIFRIRVR